MLTEEGLMFRNITFDAPLVTTRVSAHHISDRERLQRILNVTNDIVGMVKSFRLRYLGMGPYEGRSHASVLAVGELMGAVRTHVFMSTRLVCESVSVHDAREHLTEKRHPTQEEMEAVVVGGLRWEVETPEEVRASVLARYLFDQHAVEEMETIR